MSDPDVGAAAEMPTVNGNVLGGAPEPTDDVEADGDLDAVDEQEPGSESEEAADPADAADSELGDQLTSIRALGEDR